ncbi:MAG: type I-D CRISPR-associated protein Cas7/Csc2 [Rubrobacteraceae bacterium]|nr:type I-D CRISPR-associated protein Cas7/Csc2 [Rubrobacteraceae bacterium]MDQ3301792.1 type I-D CRISPR-associated protein Cas7/Csc2 [Actinomycetota bacterium]
MANDLLGRFKEELAPVDLLVPVQEGKKKVLPPHMTNRIVTIVGIKTVQSRFLPVSHEGESNETYVDKVELMGKVRAEFIARKMKGTERRSAMRLFRELTEDHGSGDGWQTTFNNWFDTKQPCRIPNALCTRCWNDSLFGSLEAGRGATFARIRYFDTFSFQDASECIASTASEEGIAIGNTVDEDLSQDRGSASLHYYEYVKAGTQFPFITVIESPTLLDVSGILNAIPAADSRGYGKYSASSGKFSTEIFTVSTGLPKFSILDMLEWADEDGGKTGIRHHFTGLKTSRFESHVREAVTLKPEDVDGLKAEIRGAFGEYAGRLG